MGGGKGGDERRWEDNVDWVRDGKEDRKNLERRGGEAREEGG